MINFNWNTKIKSSAIQYALVLSVIFAFLLGGLILYAGSNRKITTKFKVREQLRLNAISGIEYARAFGSELPLNEKKYLTLYNSGLDSVSILKENWGAFRVFKSKAIHREDYFEKIALMGGIRDKELTTLYLADFGSPLSLCGETRIEGRCALPKRGVKRAYIANQNYIGNRLIYGTTSVSENQLPAINSELINTIKEPVIEAKNEWLSPDSVINSFKNEVQYFFSSAPIVINNSFLEGKIMIESEDSIFVSGQAELHQVILKAPVVYVESGFRGSLQIYASHKVITEQNVTLEYPSVIGLIEDEKQDEISSVTIGENSTVLGSIFLVTFINDFRKEVFLDCQKKSRIAGLIYCQGKTQLSGEVIGQVYTNKFYLKTPSSAYENHILNASILPNLPDNFLVAPLLKDETYFKTIEWLH